MGWRGLEARKEEEFLQGMPWKADLAGLGEGSWAGIKAWSGKKGDGVGKIH